IYPSRSRSNSVFAKFTKLAIKSQSLETSCIKEYSDLKGVITDIDLHLSEDKLAVCCSSGEIFGILFNH
ncbi:hypothetical protein HK096_000958, partial [Nowakowskiella sp. JEL0078]